MMYKFPAILMRAIVLSRPNRFIMVVRLDSGTEMRAHCPVPGAIPIDLAGRPCLIDIAPANTKRKTQATVHAIECSIDQILHPPSRDTFSAVSWVGINQSLVNSVIFSMLRENALKLMVDTELCAIRREVRVGSSRLDFYVDSGTYIEVKAPLMFSSTISRSDNNGGRLIRHLNDLALIASQSSSRAILLLVFLYNAEVFTAPGGSDPSTLHPIRATVAKAISKGVELWQVNMKIDENGISLLDLFPLPNLLQ